MAVISRKQKRERRKMHVRKHLAGTSAKPRVSVFKSNRFLSAQLIDDEKGKCITGLSEKKLTLKKGEKPTELAVRFGEEFAKVIKSKKHEQIVFDRNGYKYHGRIKAFADSMRKSGIKF